MHVRIDLAHSVGVPRVGPAGLPRYGGVPLKAAAGRATVVKLQTINTSNVLSKTGKKYDFRSSLILS
jgi:hypothetical protein